MCEPLRERPPPEWRGAEEREDPRGAERCAGEEREDATCGAEKRWGDGEVRDE